MKYAVVIAAVTLALVCRAFLISVYKVPTQSMAPSLLAGDLVLASQVAYKFESPRRGDLVVYQKDSKIYIKRIVAMAPDEAGFMDGQLSLNRTSCRYTPLAADEAGKIAFSQEDCAAFSQPVLGFSDSKKAFSRAQGRLESGQFLVVGDNRAQEDPANLTDIITDDQIIGKPLLIWMSYSTTQDFISGTPGVRWNRILTKPR